jgi:hypothetical protein
MNFATIDYREKHPTTKGEYGLLLALARQLVGEPILFGSLGHPRELTIHFGSQVEFRGPKKTVLVEGSYVLGAVCSAWRIKSALQGRTVMDYAGLAEAARLQVATPEISMADAERFLRQVGGATVRDVDVLMMSDGYGLRIGLSDGSLIELFPTPDNFTREYGADDEYPTAPPDWELFTPYKRYLRVGPGTQWAYLPSDEPEKKSE